MSSFDSSFSFVISNIIVKPGRQARLPTRLPVLVAGLCVIVCNFVSPSLFSYGCVRLFAYACLCARERANERTSERVRSVQGSGIAIDIITGAEKDRSFRLDVGRLSSGWSIDFLVKKE